MQRYQKHKSERSNLSNIILGGQDGLVNVLGLVLGLAAATSSNKIVLAGGLAATFGESISMGAVAFTSKMAERDQQLAGGVDLIDTSSPRSVYRDSLIVGFSTLVGSLVPLVSFMVLPTRAAVTWSLIISALSLAFVGVYKAKTTTGKPFRSAFQMVVIGIGAALAGFGIGWLFR